MQADLEAAAALQAEGAALGRYLIGRPVDATSTSLYVRAVEQGLGSLDEREARLLARGVRQPWLLGLIDAALALKNPRGGVRRRLLLMFAILEASPQHCDDFLPRAGGFAAALAVVWAGARGLLRAALGLIVLRVLR